MAELPEGLVHGPSREFLAGEGLPETAAFLDFREPGETLRGGRWLVLGETEYCGSGIVLDGVTGEVHLADWTDEEFSHDRLASSLPALAGLIGEIEAVAAPVEGRRGAAVAAEVVERAEQRMRAIDPALYEGRETPPAHWGTALLVASLRWGARAGGPDGLAYELTPDVVEELAGFTGEEGVRRYRPEELPAGLTHEPTRRLLTEVGLPIDGGLFEAYTGKPLVTMAERYPDYFGEGDERDYQSGYFALGHWPHDLAVALDGATGRLELPDWYDDGEPEAYLNRDLSALLYALWTYERLRAEWGRWDYGHGGETWQVFDPLSLLHNVVDEAVRAVDPEAFATSGHSWRLLAEDDYTGGLLA